MDIVGLNKRLSRRALLKGMAVTAPLVTLACSKSNDTEYVTLGNSNAPQDNVAIAEKNFKGVCRPNCWNSCQLDVTVRGDKIVRTKRARLGTDEHGLSGLNEDGYYDRICLRGLAHVQRMYSTDRLLYPLKRISGKRGELGGYKKVSWTEAVNEVADKFASIMQTDSRALAVMNGSQAYGTVTGVMPYARFSGSLGLTSIGPNVDMALTLGLHRVFGLDRFPFFNSNELTDMPNANTIFVWGSNVTETQVQSWHFIADALDEKKRRKIRKAGRSPVNHKDKAVLVAIDTMFTVSASKSDYFVSPRPGSDTVLVLAMLREIMYQHDSWVDYTYLFENTVAPFLVNPNTSEFIKEEDIINGGGKGLAVMNKTTGTLEYTTPPSPSGTAYENYTRTQLAAGTIYTDYEMQSEVSVLLKDGTTVIASPAYKLLKDSVAEWTLEKCRDYSGLKPEATQKLTELYGDPANHPVFTYPGFGTDHYSNGHHFAHALTTLACVTGNVGKPGASCGLFIPFGFSQGAVPQAVTKAATNVPYLQLADVMERNKHFSYGVEIPYPAIKGLWIGGGNPLSNMSSEKDNFIDKIISKLDFIVCSEVTMSDSACHADIIFPACYWFESVDMISKANHPFMLLNEQAINPLGGSVTDWRIVHLVAQALSTRGFNIAANFDYTEEEYIKICTDNSTLEYEPGKKINYAALKEKKALRYLTNLSGNGPFIFGEDGIFRGNNTARAEFYSPNSSVNTATMFYLNLGRNLTATELALENLPSWEKPLEAWDGPGKDDALISKFPLAYQQEHQRWRVHSQWFDVPWMNELAGEPAVYINPADAHGIATGDKVKVSNDRGYAVVKAVITEKMRPGQTSIAKGNQMSQFIDGCYQNMTSIKYHPASVNQPFYDNRVKIEKII